MNSPALVVMARAPKAGKVKTRMQPVLAPAQCADLYKAFLADTIDLSVSMEGFSAFLAYTPLESRTAFDTLVPAGMELVPQAGNDLGQVMDGLINTLLTRGFAPVVLIGSDIPTLQPGTLHRALSALECADVCLGPSRDGGYYLIGAKQPVSPLFQNIPWSTRHVIKLTLKQARAAGLKAALLEKLGDVDVPTDLVVLKDEIRALHALKDSRIPARTEHWLINNHLDLQK